MSRRWRLWALLALFMLSLTALPAQAQTVSCTGVAAWVATTTYNPGNRVTYKGSLYESLITGANIPPDYCPACLWWKLIGVCGGGSDTTPPSVPTGLNSPSKTSTSVALAWNASSDAGGIAGYDVFRNGTNVGSPTGTSFNVTGLAANTTFSFTVRARDNAGNASAQSGAISVTTNSAGTCSTLPSVPGNLTSPSKTSSSVSLSWNASTPGANCSVTYLVFRDGSQATTSTSTNATVGGLGANTTHTFRVAAQNAFGTSGQSNQISVTTDQVSNGTLRFCPYIDVSPGAGSPIMQLASNGSGVKCYSLAFILGRGCTPSWFGIFEINTPEGDAIGQRIQELKNAGGNVIISFGGAAAPELANVCTNVASLREAYQAVINKYHPMAIDLDIEDFDPGAIDRRNQALAGVTGAQIHYTLGVLETGMTNAQTSVLQNAHDRGVNVSMVNIMAMDYGHAVSNMYNAAISAANGARSQMNGLGFGGAQLGITVMIGQNDSQGEIFTLANAQSLRNAAAGASMVSFWSMGRDNGGCPGQTTASATCSGVSQSTWGFSNILKSF
jgi:chitodextrinase